MTILSAEKVEWGLSRLLLSLGLLSTVLHLLVICFWLLESHVKVELTIILSRLLLLLRPLVGLLLLHNGLRRHVEIEWRACWLLLSLRLLHSELILRLLGVVETA